MRRIRIKLGHVNLALYGVLAALVGGYGGELHWAARTWAKLVREEFEMHREVALYYEAERVLVSDRDPEKARELLARSIAIDPYSDAVFLMGESYLMEGRLEPALDAYRRYNRIDPFHLPTYLRISEVLLEQDRPAESRRVLEQGVAFFESQLGLYRPRPDPTVPADFNGKAERVYDGYRESLDTLRGRLRGSVPEAVFTPRPPRRPARKPRSETDPRGSDRPATTPAGMHRRPDGTGPPARDTGARRVPPPSPAV